MEAVKKRKRRRKIERKNQKGADGRGVHDKGKIMEKSGTVFGKGKIERRKGKK